MGVGGSFCDAGLYLLPEVGVCGGKPCNQLLLSLVTTLNRTRVWTLDNLIHRKCNHNSHTVLTVVFCQENRHTQHSYNKDMNIKK